MREFLQKQLATCDIAVKAMEQHAPDAPLLEWFKGRRDANIIALSELNRQEALLP